MLRDYLLNTAPKGKLMAAAGLTAIAGAALLYAIPQTRKVCGRWIRSAVDGVKDKFVGETKPRRSEAGNWQQSLAKAEHLKGPLGKRRDTARINVPSAGTSAWRDEWSSE